MNPSAHVCPECMTPRDFLVENRHGILSAANAPHNDFILILLSHRPFATDELLWRNWLARLTVNQEVGGSSPPRSVY
ncbi:hypothetical protein BC937DRAFT_93540 [Endogone sp. FLAS-F59071]|nr:hypothetical protein BC937DRAFT_93540 [Endogone sp. FLAS-F59071]|eukprot:RUS21131.1 hypothetical protein BC937DRAFT_93540 [Endogone sp. FLAS-F59071]